MVRVSSGVQLIKTEGHANRRVIGGLEVVEHALKCQ